MAVVGSLIVDIGANVARIQKDIEQVRGGFKKLNNDVDKIGSSMNNMVSWIKRVGAAAGSIYALGEAWSFAERAAKFQQMEQGFANLAASHGANARSIIDNLKSMSGQTLSTAQTMEVAGKALLLGIPAEKLGKLMEIARASARVTGQDVSAAFNDIAIGIGRQSKLILDNLGIVISAEKAYEDYAISVGKTAAQLTDVEKKQAFANATLKAGQEIVDRVGKANLTAAEGMARFKATIEDLKISLGKGLIAISSFVSAGLMALSVGFAATLGYIANFLAKIIGIGSALPWVGDKFKAASEALKGFAEFEFSASQEAVRMSIEAYNVGKSMLSTVEATKGSIPVTQTLTTTTNDATEAINKQAEALSKLTAEMEKKKAVSVSPAVNLPTIADGLGGQASIAGGYIQAREAAYTREIQFMRDMAAISDETTRRVIENNERQRGIIEGLGNVMQVTYASMTDAILKFIETGKFSVGALAKIVAQQVKVELAGLAARATVWALYETAMGFGKLASGNVPAAALHFKSAGTHALVAGGAIAAAAGVNALFGGEAQRPAPGQPGGGPVPVEPVSSGLAMSSGMASGPVQNIQINIHTLTGQIDGKAQEEILRVINDAPNRNLRINADVIQGMA